MCTFRQLLIGIAGLVLLVGCDQKPAASENHVVIASLDGVLMQEASRQIITDTSSNSSNAKPSLTMKEVEAVEEAARVYREANRAVEEIKYVIEAVAKGKNLDGLAIVTGLHHAAYSGYSSGHTVLEIDRNEQDYFIGYLKGALQRAEERRANVAIFWRDERKGS